MPENESIGLSLEEIAKKLEKNNETNREILNSVKFIKHYFFWQSVFNVIKIIFIIAIVVLGVISWRSIADNIFKIYG